MIKVSGQLSVECSKCGQKHNFSPKDVPLEEVERQERDMGSEVGYNYEFDFKCDCGNNIRIEYDVWEYPIGSYNYDEVRVVSGQPISQFSYEFPTTNE